MWAVIIGQKLSLSLHYKRGAFGESDNERHVPQLVRIIYVMIFGEILNL